MPLKSSYDNIIGATSPLTRAQLYETRCTVNKCLPNKVILKWLDNPTINLDISNNYCGHQYGFISLMEAIEGMSIIRHINARDSRLGADAMKALCHTAITLPNLENLILIDNEIYIDGAKELLRTLRLNKRIHHVVLYKDKTESAVSPAYRLGDPSNRIPSNLHRALVRQETMNYQMSKDCY
eukprot:Tbor_TRINITY_DN6001_c2_g1::TRINITY_DN6001_c2_g1_i1::g.11288::m.11288